jgi:hypothetical protein
MSEFKYKNGAKLVFGLFILSLLIIIGCGTLSQYDIDSAKKRIDRDKQPQAPFSIPKE